MAIEIREETPTRMHIGAGGRAGFHGGQFLWNDEPVMCSRSLLLPLPPLPPSLSSSRSSPYPFFYYLLTMTAREIYRAFHASRLTGNSRQQPRRSGWKKRVTSAGKRASSVRGDPSLLVFVNAVYFVAAVARRQYISP